MGYPTPNNRRQVFIFICLAGMIISLFVSRAALSITMMAFVGATTLHLHVRQQMKAFVQAPVLVGMTLLFFIPFISGLWSGDVEEWQDIVRIKLPLLFLPIAFAGPWQLPAEKWRQLAFLFLLLVLSGCLWSTFFYLQNMQAIHEGYLRAKVITTPLANDHVRFSWMVSVGSLLCLLLLPQNKGFLKLFVSAAFLFFAVYLHLVAARTGLFSFYIIVGAYLLRQVLVKRNVKTTLMVAALLIAGPLLAWLALPTFQNRIKYFVYDYSFIKSNTYIPGANDGNRIQSYKAGWHILQHHPLGVGAGDVYTETNRWYASHLPQMLDSDKLYPSSEWLLYGGAAGWPGMIAFTVAMLLPLWYTPPRHIFYWRLLNVIAALSFLFDIGLEVQYGVFIYSFIVLGWWKWFSAPIEAAHS